MTLKGSQEGNSVLLSVGKQKFRNQKLRLLRLRSVGSFFEAVYAAKQAGKATPGPAFREQQGELTQPEAQQRQRRKAQ
jgi:hypothetical protein